MRVGTFVCRWFIAEQHVLDRIVISTRENGFFYGLRLPLTQCSISTANLASFLFLMEKRKKKFFFSFYFLLNIVWIFFPCVLLFKYLSNARNLLHIWVDNNSHTHTINPPSLTYTHHSCLRILPPSSLYGYGNGNCELKGTSEFVCCAVLCILQKFLKI